MPPQEVHPIITITSTAAPAATTPAIAIVLARCEEVVTGAAVVPEEDTRTIVVEPVPAVGPGSEGVVEGAVRQDVFPPVIENTGDIAWMPYPDASSIYRPVVISTEGQFHASEVALISEAITVLVTPRFPVSVESVCDDVMLATTRKSNGCCGPE